MRRAFGCLAGIVAAVAIAVGIVVGGRFWLLTDHHAGRGEPIPKVEQGAELAVPAHRFQPWPEGSPLVNAFIDRFQTDLVRALREPRPTSGTCDITELTGPEVFTCEIAYGDEVFTWQVDATRVQPAPAGLGVGQRLEDKVTFTARRIDGKSAIAREVVLHRFARQFGEKQDLRCDTGLPALRIYADPDVDTGFNCYYRDPGVFDRTFVVEVRTNGSRLIPSFRPCLGSTDLQLLLPFACREAA